MPRLRLAAITLALIPLIADASQPDGDDIIRKLALPKPTAADLARPSRGIRAVAPEAASPAPSIDLAIPFATGSSTPAPASAKIVSALGHALASSDLANDSFRIEGHADTVGAADANLALSQHRAEAIAALLTKNYGVGAARLSAVGVGSEHLVVQTPAQTSEPRNRVVRVINLGPMK